MDRLMNNNFPKTHYIPSLLTATLLLIGEIVGALAGGIIAASIGRIKTFFWCGIPAIGSFMIMYFAQNVWYLNLAMLFGGLGNSGAHITVGKLIAIVIQSVDSKYN